MDGYRGESTVEKYRCRKRVRQRNQYGVDGENQGVDSIDKLKHQKKLLLFLATIVWMDERE